MIVAGTELNTLVASANTDPATELAADVASPNLDSAREVISPAAEVTSPTMTPRKSGEAITALYCVQWVPKLEIEIQ